MRKLFLLALLISVCFNAQNKRFLYDYQFIPNKDTPTDVKRELMNLDVTETGSQFYSYSVFRSDSIIKADLEKQLDNNGSVNIKSSMQKGLVKYSVNKTYPNYEVFLRNRILADAYKVKDDRPLNWKISDEKAKVGDWQVQKAEVDFGGRHWIAWFTTDIPIQDGPYKFHGLPGLIVKIEDQTKSHSFTLQGVQNITSIPNLEVKGTEIAVNQKQYEKVLLEYEKDPTKSLKQLQMRGASIIMKDSNGGNTQMRDLENGLKQKLKSDNNKIEL